jgi:hypothetical protein
VLLQQLSQLSRTRTNLINGSGDAEFEEAKSNSPDLNSILVTLQNNELFTSYTQELFTAFNLNKKEEEQLKKIAAEA